METQPCHLFEKKEKKIKEKIKEMWLRVKTKRKLFFCYIYIFLLLCTCIRVVHTFMYVRVLNVFNYMCTIYHAVKPCTAVPPKGGSL